ncbi:hypothetical protein Krac_4629 [Ktedonobacter racemifer DSM 44963]|uniref:Uncharacterized protein n=1 Tax=Ktedonobacter racemifer DSM 44963 TaxID=485913 RepID=D6TT86_KTERA|nr:hypothetical protein Krac_4629 [Ktedonobacter racemifer DSM 44963]
MHALAAKDFFFAASLRAAARFWQNDKDLQEFMSELCG